MNWYISEKLMDTRQIELANELEQIYQAEEAGQYDSVQKETKPRKSPIFRLFAFLRLKPAA